MSVTTAYVVQLLDCMAVYHLQQQPLMPPDLVSISLPISYGNPNRQLTGFHDLIQCRVGSRRYQVSQF